MILVETSVWIDHLRVGDDVLTDMLYEASNIVASIRSG